MCIRDRYQRRVRGTPKATMELDDAAPAEQMEEHPGPVTRKRALDDDFDTGAPPVVKPKFPALTAEQMAGRTQLRRVSVPTHRMNPLKNMWIEVTTPIVKHLKLQIRMNIKRKAVEIKTSPQTTNPGAIQKAADFIKAVLLGFEMKDAIAVIRMDDLYVDSFDLDDVKVLRGDHLSRAIGRIAGKDGKTKYMLENATKTRIVLADKHVHLLGSHSKIKVVRDAICDLIMGSPAGKVMTKLRTVVSRLNDRF
eukprot:TRINITY_DN13386_c0_g1_i6.p1 TRINITY_DN13386_c0_g1~~TRINITY_DN13386_c0_g1_i6.p1  ORF type:complete len:251 (+),score=60.43 TRINITY_DN13386_c0_g1_i6:202-954(+)